MVRNDIYYRAGGPAVFQQASKPKVVTTVVADPSEKIKDPVISTKPWSNWGDSNDFPKERIEILRKNTVGKRALEIRTATHVGTGIETYIKKIVGENAVKQAFIDEKVDTWLENVEANKILSKCALDCETYYSAFIGFTWNEPRTEIIAINHYPAALCRLGKKNAQGRVDFVYMSAKWPSPSEADYVKVPTYNPLNPTKDPHFVLHVTYPTMEDTIY